MKNIQMKNIHNITLEEAIKANKELNISFIIRDGQLKGLSKETKTI